MYTLLSLKNSAQVVFGRSLGGAVAIYLANKYPDNVKGVILENTFLSVASMVDVLMPYVSWMKSLVLRIGWNNFNDIKNLFQPIMFISGTQNSFHFYFKLIFIIFWNFLFAGDSDELVPPSHMKLLYEVALKSKHRDFFGVSGGKHNDTWVRAGSKYYKVVILDDYI